MNRIEIKKWLLESGITQADIAREVGVSHTLVSLVLKGERSSRRVIEALLRRGCPEDLVEKRAA